ncbi:MAG: prepilin-type N-terminal cleavage/methylation domain-containing protein [Burkholderiales bacterium]|nr:prepilin-type N-terminal cleavage/methylation domain-containing protein [Burkholderiales bacterium]
MMSPKRAHSLHLQAGFTLLELLFAMAIVLVVVVAAQRYAAGVLTDREHLSAQQDQTSQINVVLSNMQNDVARAGFIPVASVSQWTEGQLSNVGVDVRCLNNNCTSKELRTAYWTRENPAYDCVHNKVETTRTAGWVEVENVYRFQKTDGVWVLGCDGNGGGGDWEGFTNPTEGDIENFNWTLDSNAADSGAKLLHFCVTTRTAKNNQVAGNMQAHSCSTGKALVNDNTWVYQTIELDMLVRPSQIGVLP